METKSPAHFTRRRPVRLWTALIAAAALAAPLTGSALAHPASAAPTQAGSSFAEAGGITLPGVAPGKAKMKVTGSQDGRDITAENDVLRLGLEVRQNRAQITGLLNKQTGEKLDIDTNQFFQMTLADGSVIDDSHAKLTGIRTEKLRADDDSPQVADADGGRSVELVYEYAKGDVRLELTWTLMLRDDSNYVQQSFRLAPATGAPADQSIAYTSLTLLDVALPSGRVEGRDDGSPVVAGGQRDAETFFLGLENPMSEPVAADGSVRISIPAATPLTADEPVVHTTAIGVSLPDQMRRSFQYYVERERAHARHTFLHYQSWYDLKPPGLMIDSEALTTAVNIFGSQLTERGAEIDGFWVDDGWDYLRSPQVDESDLNVWDFDPTQFPDGFAPQLEEAQKYDASMAVWMSPFGGYGESNSRRQQLNASKPADERFETGPAGFSLSGERYYTAFRDRIFDMMDNQGVRGFKLDGIGGGLFQTGPNPQYLADYEALLRLTQEMREHQPDVWINATVGTWGSPYWLWYVDSIWRDGHDNGQVGEGSTTQRYMSHRDEETMRNQTIENPLFPTSNVMNHGFVFSEGDHNPHFVQDTDLTKPEVRADIARDAKAYFALGLGLQELYVRHTIVAPDVPGADFFWDTIAANAKWARDNEQLLSDSHMVGSAPSSGRVYGNAAWSAADGGSAVLMLRNPSASVKKFTIDVAKHFELPEGAATRWQLVERDGAVETVVVDAAQPYTFELQPFQVLVFEGSPSSAEPTPSPVEPDPEPLDRACWSATASDEETQSENGAAANVLDGSGASIWHSGYSGGVVPMPHWIQLDLCEPTTWQAFDYLPRPNVGTGNGVIKGYVIEISDDGENWTEVAAGEWTTWERQLVQLDEPVTSRYVRLTATSSYNGQPYAGAAELNLWPAEEADAG